MGKKKLIAAALDPDHETFVVHVTSFSSNPLIASLDSISLNADVYPFCRPPISGLITKEASTKVINKYVNFANVLSPDFVSALPKHTKINHHAIKLVDN